MIGIQQYFNVLWRNKHPFIDPKGITIDKVIHIDESDWEVI